jgi:hydrocephalus-inducing protein
MTAAPGSSSGTEVSVDVTYEPSKIGEARATLFVSSEAGGEYTFPLFGTSIAPKPQVSKRWGKWLVVDEML